MFAQCGRAPALLTHTLDTRAYWRWGTCPRCRSDLENRVARSGSRGALGPPRTQSGPKNVGAGTADVVRGRSELTAGSQPVSSDGANSVFQGPLRHLGQVPASRGLGHATLCRGGPQRAVLCRLVRSHTGCGGGVRPPHRTRIYICKHSECGRDHNTQNSN